MLNREFYRQATRLNLAVVTAISLAVTSATVTSTTASAQEDWATRGKDTAVQRSLSDLGAGEGASAGAAVRPVAYQVGDPMPPVQRTDAISRVASQNDAARSEAEKHSNHELNQALLGGSNAIGQLSPERQKMAQGPATDAVLGAESLFRKTTDTGNLVGKSITVRGVSSQQRTPITTDTRVRGQRVGQVLAAGSFWAPVRMDLDTMMSKIDSRMIDSLLVIKGPFSPRYGPGFSFIDIDLLATPRYDGGLQHHGTTSADYQTNGQQLYGRQTLFGGSDHWGYRVSYGHRTGNDYETGAGTSIPASYNSRDINVALGFDPSHDQRVEFNYLRLDQTGVEYPGLVFDTRYLVTDGYELKYFNQAPQFADYHFAEVWFNRTRFEGDTFGEAKNRQIPSLKYFLYSPSGMDGTGVTDGDGSSLGYRNELVFGERGYDHLAFGTDMIYLRQGINDREDQYDPTDNNFPLLPSDSMDLGFYLERVRQVGANTQINAGARIDTISTTAQRDIDGFTDYYFDDDPLDQTFTTWMTYITSETQLNEHWRGNLGLGLGQRPPTLTEMYTHATFIGTLQKGLTFLTGDPELSPETLKQVDIGLSGDYDRLQLGANYFHAWIEDFITYDSYSAYSGAEGLPGGAGFVNTDRAVMQGVEAYGRYQWLPSVDLFGGLSYVEGEDRTRDSSDYFDDDFLVYDRSGVTGTPVEPLPGIPPLDSRLGIFLHQAGLNPGWGVEVSMRAVARQDRIAATLGEVATPGFSTIDIRGFKRIGKNLLLTGGVENLTDRFYQEHLDYRSGLGVYRPGIGFYTGVELNY